MGCLLPALSLLLLSASVSHATLQAQMYWHTVLPNTAMPSAIRVLLHPDVSIDEKTGTLVNAGKAGVNVNTGYNKAGGGGGTSVNVGTGYHKPSGGTNVNVGKGGVNVGTGYHKPGGGTNVNVGKGGVNVATGYNKPGGGTNVNVGHGGVNVHSGYKKPGGGTNVNVGHGGVNVGTAPKGKPVIVNVGPFIYHYAATETQIHDDPRVTLFFLEKDLHSGAKMTLHFIGANNVATFLTRRAAENMPFSSEKAPEILSKFSIEPSSAEAEVMKKTINECEEPAADGEQKVCATSLESMVDFSTASLGTRDLVAVSTTVGTGAEKEQEYTLAGVRKLAGSELVACHLEPYAYVVFYCHKTQKTAAYHVEMVGKNGAKVKAVAVCHYVTAAWNPGHVAFKVLKVKPGTIPVCHFVPQDHVVWAHSN